MLVKNRGFLLDIVRQIAKRQRDDAEVKASPGPGVTFFFSVAKSLEFADSL